MKTEKREIPAAACCFVQSGGAITLAEPPEGEVGVGARHRFEMLANTGKPILNHWLWGNLGIDLSGVDFKEKIPALKDHNPDLRAGFTETIEITDAGIRATGRMLKTSPTAAEILSDAADGFPWQASVKLVPSRIEVLEAGASTKVNGHEMTGPGHVFRESSLREVTFTALGADDDTNAEAFADGGKVEALFQTEVNEMTKTNEPADPPAVDLGTVAPAVIREHVKANAGEFADLFANARAAALAAERERVAAILTDAHPAQRDLADRLVADGVELAEALKSLHADLKERLDALVAKLTAETDPPLAEGNDVPDDEPADDSTPPTEAALRAEFEKDAANIAEFGDGDEGFKLYSAFRRNAHRTDTTGMED